MTGAGAEWLQAMALAGLPALLCRRDTERFTVVDRTAELTTTLAGVLDETDLLGRIAAAGESPTVLRGDDGSGWECVIQAVDADHLLAIVRMPTEQQRYYESFFPIVESLPVIIARIDRRYRHLYVNPAIEAVTGLTDQQFAIRTQRELGMPDDLVELWLSVYDRIFTSGEGVEAEFDFPGPDGLHRYLFRVVPEFGAAGEVRTVLSTARDVTELKVLQDQLTEVAQTDPLTGLLNRRSLLDRLDTELGLDPQRKGTLSLLLLDVDDFKSINDRFGHPVGDSVLQAIGSVLRQEIGTQDFAGRLGGDEFCVGLVGAGTTSARTVADRIRRRIGELAEPHIGAPRVGVSVGVVTADENDRSVADLVGRADRAMYWEKFPPALWMRT